MNTFFIQNVQYGSESEKVNVSRSKSALRNFLIHLVFRKLNYLSLTVGIQSIIALAARNPEFPEPYIGLESNLPI